MDINQIEEKIEEHMEVVGSDGEHVGIVDHLQDGKLKLIKHDSNADGQHHLIELSTIANIDNFVTLNVTAADAMKNWEGAGQ